MAARRFAVSLWLLSILLHGCAHPAGEIFPPVEPPVVFPSPPDLPRFRYIGQLSADTDLKPAVSGWQALAAAVGGPQAARGVSTPLGLAASRDEKLYVTDTAQHCVHLFDLRTRRYAAIADAGDQPLGTPADVAVVGSTLFASDSALHCVFVFDGEGRFQRTFGADRLKRPVGIAVFTAELRDSNNGPTRPASRPDDSETRDTVYVVDTIAHCCVAFNPDGTERFRFGSRGSRPGQFNFPTDIAVHPRTGVVIADTLNFRVQRFSFDGKFLNAIGTRGDGAGDFALPKGVAIDAAGRIYVVDAQFENVQVFTPEGQLLLAFGEEGQGPGQFWLTGQACVDSRNRLWVADSYNRRVQAFQILPEAAR